MEAVLKQILGKLDVMDERMNNMQAVMATKEDLNRLQEQVDDIRGTMATKEELSEIRATMATKEELNEIRTTMATKEDVEMLPYIQQAVVETVSEVKEIRQALQDVKRYDFEIKAINNRLFRVEAEVARLSDQMPS